MKKLMIVLIAVLLALTSSSVLAKKHKHHSNKQNHSNSKYFGERLCSNPDYICKKVRRGENWETLFPNADQRDIVRRVNRMNNEIWAGMVIAVPRNLEHATIYSVSPFPRYIAAPGEKVIYVSQKLLAWGAYDAQGELVWWGPVSPGKGYCADTREKVCVTPGGSYRVYSKDGLECISKIFPKRANGIDGGAPMPYCMFFYEGFALHGSADVPGYAASHGCARLYPEDAKWLNQQFVDLPGVEGRKGTRVVVEAREQS